MERLEIARRANLLDEAYLLLYQWVNEGDIDKLRESRSDYLLSKPEEYGKRFDLVSEMFHFVLDNMKTDKERIEYYFKKRGQDFSTLAMLALVRDSYDTSDEIPPFRKRMEELGADRIKELAINLSGEEAINTPEEMLRTMEDLIVFLDNTEYDDASKWEAIRIISNQETYYNEVSRILYEVKELLDKKYRSRIAEISEEFHQYWSGCQDILSAINEKTKIFWDVSEKGCLITPSIFMPFSMVLSVDPRLKGRKDSIQLGILLDINFDLSNRKMKKEGLVEIGKLLSDKSKVDILEFISTKPSYGKEIANELKLSTATISYHVNALLKIGFIQAELISNKVYYSINRDRITGYMEDIKDFFIRL